MTYLEESLWSECFADLVWREELELLSLSASIKKYIQVSDEEQEQKRNSSQPKIMTPSAKINNSYQGITSDV